MFVLLQQQGSVSVAMDIEEQLIAAITPVVTPLRDNIVRLQAQIKTLTQELKTQQRVNQELQSTNISLQQRCNLLESKLAQNNDNENNIIKYPEEELQIFIPSSLDFEQDNSVPTYFNSSPDIHYSKERSSQQYEEHPYQKQNSTKIEPGFGLLTPRSMSKPKTHPKAKLRNRRNNLLTSWKATVDAESDIYEDVHNSPEHVLSAAPQYKRRRVNDNKENMVLFHDTDFQDIHADSDKENDNSQLKEPTQDSQHNDATFNSFLAELDTDISENSPHSSQSDHREKPASPMKPAVYNVDQINEHIKLKNYIDITFNPLSGKPWIMEDFRNNNQLNLNKTDIVQTVVQNFHDDNADILECKECRKFYEAAGYGAKMNSPTWDESPSKLQQYRKVPPILFKCKHKKQPSTTSSSHNSKISYNSERQNSPPGFFNADFPTSQALKEEKLLVKRKTLRQTMERFLTATASDPYKRAFIFRNKLFNNIVDSGFFKYDSQTITNLYTI